MIDISPTLVELRGDLSNIVALLDEVIRQTQVMERSHAETLALYGSMDHRLAKIERLLAGLD